MGISAAASAGRRIEGSPASVGAFAAVLGLFALMVFRPGL